MSGRKVAKRACDACKIRKIKCSEVSPCDGCAAAGITCTFVKTPHTRGPRKLRSSTLDEIKQAQQQWEDYGLAQTTAASEAQDVGFATTNVPSLVLQLCVYRLRMYPVWPIIKVERLVASLQRPQPDSIEVFALAYAVAAATIAQIKSKESAQPGAVTAEMMEAQCQNAKAMRDSTEPPNVTTVRTAFFLHVYYENQTPGGLKSILYLREAITMAHMMGLHRESYYQNVAVEEQQIRRRTLWLLFVTERGLSMLHRLPVTLKTKIEFPSTQDTDEQDVLSGFQKLASLFWSFDQSGIFDHLDMADWDRAHSPWSDLDRLLSVRRQLEDNAVDGNSMNDIQAVDLALTRQWMRVILWQVSENQSLPAHNSNDDVVGSGPIEMAEEFISAVQYVPDTAIEAHGPGLELKIFEIACAVVDAVTPGSLANSVRARSDPSKVEKVLERLRDLLSCNKRLHSMLCDKITSVQQTHHSLSGIVTERNSQLLPPLQQTQALDAGAPLCFNASPSTESWISGNSPTAMQNHGVLSQPSTLSIYPNNRWEQRELFLSTGQQEGAPFRWSMDDQQIPSVHPNSVDTHGSDYDFNMDSLDANSSFNSLNLPHSKWNS